MVMVENPKNIYGLMRFLQNLKQYLKGSEMKYNGKLVLLKDSHPALRIPSVPVTLITSDIKELAVEMSKLMVLEQGIGIAAPQVGKHIQLLLIDTRETHKDGQFLIILNPEILHEEGASSMKEGCLSFPGKKVKVNRSRKVKIKYLTLNGTYDIKELDGYEARVFLHELDHLNGIVFTDYE